MSETEKRARIGGGSRKGIPNKTTASIKEAISAVFEMRGGIPALLKWSEENETDFYTKVWVKMLPQDIKAEIAGKDGGPLMPVINVTVTRSENG